MKNAIIALDGLTKHYHVGERAGGLLAAAGSIFRRRMRTVRAVEAVSFAIAPGEVVGFPGTERRRQDDHPQDAGRSPAPYHRDRPCAGLCAVAARP